MRSNMRDFESNVKSLDALNGLLKNVDKDSIEVGRFGHAKVTISYDTFGKKHSAEYSRKDLAQFARRLAKDAGYNLDIKTFKKFEKRFEDISKLIDKKIGESKSKRVKVGRKIASALKHFHTSPEGKNRRTEAKIERHRTLRSPTAQELEDEGKVPEMPKESFDEFIKRRGDKKPKRRRKPMKETESKKASSSEASTLLIDQDKIPGKGASVRSKSSSHEEE